jgi:hypothetical protein
VFQPFTPRTLSPGRFKVVLVIDMREGGKDRDARLELVEALRRHGVEVERRTLWLGDMIWVARPVGAQGPLGLDDVVLDSIVERKRLDDLTHSIKDGRYASQKVCILVRARPGVLRQGGKETGARRLARFANLAVPAGTHADSDQGLGAHAARLSD